MFQLSVKPGIGAQKTIYFTNPKCGHELEFGYSAPYRCQDPSCNEVVPPIEKLMVEHSAAARVKYFAEGKL